MIADGQPLYRLALANEVSSRPEFELVAAAGDGREALDRISTTRPHVAVLDTAMPGIDGPEILAAIDGGDPRTRILFCGSSTDAGLIYDWLASGAGGYIDKAAEAEEICEAIASVGRGQTFVSPRFEREVLDQIGLRGAAAAAEHPLTVRELDVLRLLAQGLPAPEIAQQLGIERSTVKTHLKSIYAKLEVSSQTAAVAEAMRRGLVG